MGWQWHQLDNMRTLCTSLETDNYPSTSSLNFYRPNALPDAQPTVSKYITGLKGRLVYFYVMTVISILRRTCRCGAESLASDLAKERNLSGNTKYTGELGEYRLFMLSLEAPVLCLV